MSRPAPLQVRLVQQGVWEMPLESMPLACGYLKAMAMADAQVRARAVIEICNFRGGATHAQMADRLLSAGPPDVLAFSVFGWSFRAFGALAATFKQLNPDGWVIFGGTHVSDQAERVFQLFPEVDIVVNGEGELTFTELLRARLDGASHRDLAGIAGISWRTEAGQLRHNPARPRIENLDIIPSPLLTGAIDLTDDTGAFRYDVALLETNRGCPYKCSFCYWGGAVGQRVRAFSRDRLRQELELLAKLKVYTVVACDANFGMLPIDIEFTDDLIATRERFGYPRAFESSWAKNKSRTFYEIVHKMKDAGLRSSFTLALQSLGPAAIETMNRRNMKVNEWQDLAQWLAREGLDCYAELIWGVPGETPQSFLEGYDELARWISRIAIYPLMLLPNTEYSQNKAQYGIVSVRGDHDDFEYVLAHSSMTFGDNAQIQQFIFWARVLAENAVLRFLWPGLRELAGLPQSAIIQSFADWVDQAGLPLAEPLRAAAGRAHGLGAPAFATAIGYLFAHPDGKRVLRHWWSDAMRPRLGDDVRPLLDEIFRYDLLTMPVCVASPADWAGRDEDGHVLAVAQTGAESRYVRRGVVLNYDVPRALAELRAGRKPGLEPSPTALDLEYRAGALNAVQSTNHEEIVHFMGTPAAGPPGC